MVKLAITLSGQAREWLKEKREVRKAARWVARREGRNQRDSGDGVQLRRVPC